MGRRCASLPANSPAAIRSKALAVALVRELAQRTPQPCEMDDPAARAARLALEEFLIAPSLTSRPDWLEVLLFIDQFEELFSLVKPPYVEPFIDLLVSAVSDSPELPIVITLRADFYARCVGVSEAGRAAARRRLSAGSARNGALYKMIGPNRRPALDWCMRRGWRIAYSGTPAPTPARWR